MARRLRTTARKKPRQERSQATVDAILSATAHVLCTIGYDRASTNRIALSAGVSIGSVYQYFSHRDAILQALQNREFDRTLTLMQGVLGDAHLGDEPGREALYTTVAQLVADMRPEAERQRMPVPSTACNSLPSSAS